MKTGHFLDGFLLFLFFFTGMFSITAYGNDAVRVSDQNRETYSPTITYKLKEPEDVGNFSKDHWTRLPIWGDKAKALGYEIELPLVLSVQYVNQSQMVQQKDGIHYSNIRTENLWGVQGINLAKNPDGTPDIIVNTGKTKEHSETKGIRAGVWVLPFVQVYGILNKIKGHTTTPTTSYTQLDLDSNPLIGMIAEAFLKALFKEDYLGNGLVRTSERVRINYDAVNYGGGVAFAGGYEKMFYMIDLNYTFSNMDYSDDYIRTFVASTRVGYNGKMFDRPLRLWVGLMGQYVSSKVTGKMTHLEFEGLTGSLTSAINPNGKGKFEVKQKLVEPINFLVGGRYTFAKHAAILLEGGYGGKNGRTSFMANIEILF